MGRALGLTRLAVLLLVLLAACSSEAPAPTATPAAFVCPVTPSDSAPPPDPHTATFTTTWYGDDELWAGLAPPYKGQWFAGPSGVKVLWYHAMTGKLTIEGSRLDGASGPLRADIPDGYGATGYQASSVIFPVEGCWKVTGRAGNREYTFVVQVLPAAENPLK